MIKSSSWTYACCCPPALQAVGQPHGKGPASSGARVPFAVTSPCPAGAGAEAGREGLLEANSQSLLSRSLIRNKAT